MEEFSQKKIVVQQSNFILSNIQCEPINTSKISYTCILCSLPYDNPTSCSVCDNIFCQQCLENYFFEHKVCPTGCTLLNSIQPSIQKRRVLYNIQMKCLICKKLVSVFDTQRHFINNHGIADNSNNHFQKKIYCQPRCQPNEEEEIYENIKGRQMIPNLENFKELQCQICFDPISFDCQQCIRCGQVWCTHCLESLISSKEQICPNKCKPSVYCQPSVIFFEQYHKKYTFPCEQCQKIVPLEFYDQHLRRYHSQFRVYPHRAIEFLRSAEIEVEREQFQISSQLASIAITFCSNKNIGSGFFVKARSKSKQGQKKAAITCYLQAIEYNFDLISSTFNLGVCYTNLKLHEKSLEQYLRAIQLDPASYSSYNNLGCTYLHLKKYNEALTAFDKGLKIKPNYSPLIDSKAGLFLELGKDKEAFEGFDLAQKLDPNYCYPLLGKAKYFIKYMNYSEAIFNLKEALVRDPNFTEAKELMKQAVELYNQGASFSNFIKKND